MNERLLSVLIVVPIAAAVITLFIPRQNVQTIRGLSVGAMLLELLVSLSALGADFSQVGYHFYEERVWVESLGISYRVGLDGISLWLVLLTTVLTPVALWASWLGVRTKIKEFAAAFLILESAMIGTFVALDLFLFYVFWELMLVPMYLIVGVWGGPQRVYAAVKFFLFTMVGSLLMLVAILYLVGSYEDLAGSYSFDLDELSRVVLPYNAQLWCFAAFALAFAIKVPMFPFHTWLPDAHVQAPTGGSVILAAVMLKLGAYGFLRFAIPLFPLAAHYLGPTVALFAVIGIIYGAYCAWVQRDVKKLVAYSSVSHLGFVMLGIFAMNGAGVSGAVLQMVNHGIFHRSALHFGRRHLRSAPHPRPSRVRRPRHPDANLCDGVRHRGDELRRAARHKRFHRRVHDPSRHVRLRRAHAVAEGLRSFRRDRRDSRRDLHASRRPQDVLGSDLEGERETPRPHVARGRGRWPRFSCSSFGSVFIPIRFSNRCSLR